MPAAAPACLARTRPPRGSGTRARRRGRAGSRCGGRCGSCRTPSPTAPSTGRWSRRGRRTSRRAAPSGPARRPGRCSARTGRTPPVRRDGSASSASSWERIESIVPPLNPPLQLRDEQRRVAESPEAQAVRLPVQQVDAEVRRDRVEPAGRDDAGARSRTAVSCAASTRVADEEHLPGQVGVVGPGLRAGADQREPVARIRTDGGDDDPRRPGEVGDLGGVGRRRRRRGASRDRRRAGLTAPSRAARASDRRARPACRRVRVGRGRRRAGGRRSPWRRGRRGRAPGRSTWRSPGHGSEASQQQRLGLAHPLELAEVQRLVGPVGAAVGVLDAGHEDRGVGEDLGEPRRRTGSTRRPRCRPARRPRRR